MTQTGQNRHLDTIEGRYWLQLEWRALAQALRLSGQERTRALRDARAFRLTRRTTFPGAAENERLDEIREGLAQYTGTVVAAATAAEAAASAIDQLADGEARDVRSNVCVYVWRGVRNSARRMVTRLDATGSGHVRFGTAADDRLRHPAGGERAGGGGAVPW